MVGWGFGLHKGIPPGGRPGVPAVLSVDLLGSIRVWPLYFCDRRHYAVSACLHGVAVPGENNWLENGVVVPWTRCSVDHFFHCAVCVSS